MGQCVCTQQNDGARHACVRKNLANVRNGWLRPNFDLFNNAEFYAPHSYNSSQWITGCLPYRNGTVVFQQVRSYTDQVAGVASDAKHIVGRELLKDKMLKSFERLCDALGQCH